MTGMEMVWIVAALGVGAIWGGLLACWPGLHVYTVLGLCPALAHGTAAGACIPEAAWGIFFLAMIVSWSLLNAIPSILLSAPDESALFTVLPGQAMALRGRGLEAIDLTLRGGLAGFGLWLLAFGLVGGWVLPMVHRVLSPHYGWILWAAIGFMLMSEWPRGSGRSGGGWGGLADGWLGLGAGLLTFLLSGLLGFIVWYDLRPASVETGSALGAAFVGLFAVPGLWMNGFSRVRLPPQRRPRARLELESAVLGTAAGWAGGSFAAYFPGITGGLGGLLAGHAMGVRDDRAFLFSQGASKAVYYGGGFLLLWAPGFERARGGGAAIFRGLAPMGDRAADFPLMIAGAAVTLGIAYGLGRPLMRGMLRLIRRVDERRISGGALLILIGLVGLQQGGWGLLVMAVGAAIGSLPLLFGSRRMNALGVVLLPLACNLAGWGPRVAEAMGLLKM